jgi:hypothetical protein
MSMDHPLVRRGIECPMCHDTKQSGCVTCWGCHNVTEFGTAEQREVREAAIDAAEEQLEAHEERRASILA